jgi:hypothetical protein
MDTFMNTLNFQKSLLTFIAVTGLALSAMTVAAQNSPAASAPQLPYGVPQIIQLSHAKISDDTIIAYIHNSGNSYGLDANQIIYLRQQGISDNILNVMLNQPKVASAPAQPATQPDNSSTAQTSTAYAQPTTTYVQTVPSSQAYVIPDTQTYYYNAYYAQPYYYPYPYYAWPYPGVSVSFGFGGRWGGGGWRGGGFHGGGWHH